MPKGSSNCGSDDLSCRGSVYNQALAKRLQTHHTFMPQYSITLYLVGRFLRLDSAKVAIVRDHYHFTLDFSKYPECSQKFS